MSGSAGGMMKHIRAAAHPRLYFAFFSRLCGMLSQAKDVTQKVIINTESKGVCSFPSHLKVTLG